MSAPLMEKGSYRRLLQFFFLLLFILLEHSQTTADGSPTCNGSIAECYEEDEFLLDSELSRRILEEGKSISYGALNRDQPTCKGSAATGRVTTKVDVYAFGVILMELITGRRALDDTQPEERAHLVTWFRRVLISKEDISNFIDPALDPDEDARDSIKKVAELAGHCTAREAYQRPDMGHAVNVLGPLVEQWKPACQEEDESYGIDLHLSLPQALQRWQDEGTSTMASGFYHTRTESQSSIPDQPSEFNTFNSSKAR